MSSNGVVEESKAPAPAEGGAAAPAKPKKLKRVERPNKDAHIAKVERMQAGIAKATEKRDSFKKQHETLITAVKAAQAEVKAGRDTMAALKEDRAKLKSESDEIRAQLTALRGPPRGAGAGAGGRRSDAGGKRAVRFRSAEEAERAIDELEYRQKSEAMSLSEEKVLIKQLGEYRAALSTFASAAAGREAAARTREASEATRAGLKTQLDEKKKELDAIHARMSAQHEILQGLNAKVEAARAKFVPLNKERDEARADVDARWTDLKATRAAFTKANLAWKNFKDAERKQREEEKRQQREQFLAKVEAEDAEEDAEPEEEVKPWQEEMQICDLMTTYVTKLKPREYSSSAASTPTTGVTDTSSTEFAGLKGGRKGVRGGDELDMFAGTKKKKAGRRRVQGAKKKNIAHNLETLGCFRKIGVDAPRTIDNIDECITQLAEKKAFYETAPPPAKPEPKSKGRKGRGAGAGAGAGAGGRAAGGETVTTPYGLAKVVSRREGGQVVVQMTGFAATAFLQPDQVTASK